MPRILPKFLAGALFAASLFLLPLIPARAQSLSAACPISAMVAKVVTTTTYTIGIADQCSLLVFNNASAVAVTLPRKSTNFPNGFVVGVADLGAGTATVTPTTSTINGTTTAAATTGTGFMIYSDGTNYYTVP